jgi:cobalamin biosynthesis Mg chelatase CobN
VNDALVEGTHTGTISHTATSADASYNGIAIASVIATITDNDGPVSGPEGSHQGSGGPSGSEGSFGFRAVLAGPFVQAAGHESVRNVSYRPGAKATTDEQQGIPVAIILAGAALLALAAAIVRGLR